MWKSNHCDQLNVGSGELPLKNCVNFDLKVYHRGDKQTDVIGDIRHMPFKPESFKKIHCYHTIEHLAYEEAKTMLEDCHGLLQHDGKIIIEGPDILKAVEYYKADHFRLAECLFGDLTQMASGKPEYRHLYGWTGWMIQWELLTIGFQKCKVGDGITHAKPDRDYQVTGIK